MFASDALKNKSILVTGGGSGLGFAMATQFAKLGAKIAICGRSESKLVDAARKLSPLTGKVCYRVVDVRDYDAIGKAFLEIKNELGTLNCLVNNAAGNFFSTSEDLSANGFKAIIDTNLIGTFNCSQHFAKQLIASKEQGVVLNIVTTYAVHGSAFVLPSACSKAGVLALTKSLASEWAAYGIRLNAIAPGPVLTEAAKARLMPEEIENAYLASLPMKRFGKPEEVAHLASFLVSDLSEYINGECISVDGGENLKAGQFNFLTELMPRDKLKKLFSDLKKGKN